jgi:hypothetical protein
MRVVTAVLVALTLVGCQHEDAGVRAAKMEQQDDATCQQQATGKGADAYQQCRKNLMFYRQQVAAEEEQRRARVQAAGESLQQAGAALQNIH